MTLDIFRWIAALGFMFTMAGNAHAQATVYTATSTSSYATNTDFTAPCGAGPCQNFTLAMTASGSFTTSAPLAANLISSNISPSVTSFSFTDGISTYSSSDPEVRIFQMFVSTNAGGNLTSVNIIVERWLTGPSTHVAGNRWSYVQASTTNFIGTHNTGCNTVGVSAAGAANTCIVENADLSRSVASSSPVVWSSAAAVAPSAAKSIPTLSEWGIVAVAILMAVAAFLTQRRSRL